MYSTNLNTASFKTFRFYLNRTSHRWSRGSSSTPDFKPGDTGFKSQLGFRLSLLSFYVVFLNPSRLWLIAFKLTTITLFHFTIILFYQC